VYLRADPKRHGILQPVTLERHARADSEKIARLEAEHRPARDDLLDCKDALAKRELLFDAAVNCELHFQGFQLCSGRLQQHAWAEASARREIFSQQMVLGGCFAPADVASGDIEQQAEAGYVVPYFFRRDSLSRLADDHGKTRIAINFL